MAELQDSHLIPKFIERRFFADAPTGRARAVGVPNRPIQRSGHTYRLLCRDCEQRFASRERAFAENIFDPWWSNELRQFGCTEEVLYFAASLTFRLLKSPLATIDAGYTAREMRCIDGAASALRPYLLDRAAYPLYIQHHIYFPPVYEGDIDGLNLALLGSLMPSVLGAGEALYSSFFLGGMLVVALPEIAYVPQPWGDGTQLSIGNDIKTTGQIIHDRQFGEEVLKVLRAQRDAEAEITPDQNAQTRSRYERVPAAKLSSSRSYRAVEQDRKNVKS